VNAGLQRTFVHREINRARPIDTKQRRPGLSRRLLQRLILHRVYHVITTLRHGMAASDVSSGSAITTRLYDLLRRARAIKRSTSIDPPLQVSALVDDGESLIDFPDIGEEPLSSLIEGAAKTIFYASVVSCTQVPRCLSSYLPGPVRDRRCILRNRMEPPGHTPVLRRPKYVPVSLVSWLFLTMPDICSPQLVLLLLEHLASSNREGRCSLL
jgi:hypothetical protein